MKPIDLHYKGQFDGMVINPNCKIAKKSMLCMLKGFIAAKKRADKPKLFRKTLSVVIQDRELNK